MIDINELRRLAQAATPNVGHACKYQDHHSLREGHVDFENADLFIASERPQEDAAFYAAANPQAILELLDRLEAAEKERDALRAKIEQMERQEPVRWFYVTNGEWDCYSRERPPEDAYDAGSLMALYALPGAQPAPSVPKCPYPCGWRNLLKHAIEDGAYLARQINEDEPVTENARAVTMRMVMRLRDVLLIMNSAAPEAKP